MNNTMTGTDVQTKFCKHCGEKIPFDAIVCTHCGRQVEDLRSTNNNEQPKIIINNANNNTNMNTNMNTNINPLTGRAKNKWVAIILCVLLGWIGGHKFYEGKIGMGILYLCTCGIGFIGVIIDLLVLLTKPEVYYV